MLNYEVSSCTPISCITRPLCHCERALAAWLHLCHCEPRKRRGNPFFSKEKVKILSFSGLLRLRLAMTEKSGWPQLRLAMTEKSVWPQLRLAMTRKSGLPRHYAPRNDRNSRAVMRHSLGEFYSSVSETVRPTNSSIAIGALSPLRKPHFKIRT
jgi:hypothetical protein